MHSNEKSDAVYPNVVSETNTVLKANVSRQGIPNTKNCTKIKMKEKDLTILDSIIKFWTFQANMTVKAHLCPSPSVRKIQTIFNQIKTQLQYPK